MWKVYGWAEGVHCCYFISIDLFPTNDTMKEVSLIRGIQDEDKED